MNKYFTLIVTIIIPFLMISLVISYSSSRVYAVSEEIHIPGWIKNVAKWWADDKITDSDFLQGIQYLLVKGIIKTPETEISSNHSSEIPHWIKIDAKFWSEDNLGDATFVQGIKYLIQDGFISIPNAQAQNQNVKYVTNPDVWFSPLPEMIGIHFVGSKDFKPLEGQQSTRGSKDFMELFTENSPWKNAVQHVRVFKLNGDWVETATDLELMQTITYLNNHNITIAIESGPLESTPTCGQGEGFWGKERNLQVLNRIKDVGGTVRFIALDEPFFFGSIYDGPNACHWSTLKTAQEVAIFVQSIKISFPDITIGDIEPTNKGASVIQYEDWIKTYFAVTGSNFAFFHLDTGWSQPNWPIINKELEIFLHEHKIRFGMIYFGNFNDGTDEEWLAHAEERMIIYETEAGGRPDDVIFQSWHDHPYYVLPESSSHTFTHLILSYFKTHSVLDMMSSQSLNNIQINGSLTQVDGKPLAEAAIQLFTSPTNKSGIFTNSNSLSLGNTQTDTNGTFHFNLNMIKSDTILQAKYSGDENHWPAYLEIPIHVSN